MDTNSNGILSVLCEVCTMHPEQEAIVEDGVRTMTYRQLWEDSRRLATYLKNQPDTSPFVGIKLSKSAAYVVSMIGSWMAGKAFVPIGLDLPSARQQYIINHADIGLCVDDKVYKASMSYPMAETIAYPNPDEPAYMIYSSGTTGIPKGILVGHAGLCNLARCQRKMFGLEPPSRYLFFLSINFDASISDILVTLTAGATLIIESMPQEELASTLFQIVEKRQVTHTDIPPALLKMLNLAECPDCLQTIVIGGEPADIGAVRRWSQKLNLINVYGPTEATVCTSMCRCNPQWDSPLLGQVLDYTKYSVYADGKLDAIDGELWISGIGLAIGYYKNKELTRQKFPIVDGVRYYRTSDHVRVTADHEIVFIGRIDRQVKYHGQLIELEEIEHRLRVNKNVKYAAVIKRKISANHEKETLVAFIQSVDNTLSSEIEHELRQICKYHLPKWMMPSFIEFVERMPLTPTGKIDFQALCEWPLTTTITDREYKYASKEEETIAEAMADVLKLPALAPDDNFFLQGGDSLDTLLLVAKLQQQGIAVTSTQLRQASTPRLLTQSKKQDSAMCKHSSELESEWLLSAPEKLPSAGAEPSGVVLMTGVTGFLGSHLLNEILHRNLYQKVKCLVRCSSSAIGLKRIEDTFRKYGLETKHFEKIEVYCGDVTQPLLGLAPKLYEQFVCQISDIYHCAAAVNMLASYDALKNTNVIGTQNILDFCFVSRRKRLHYASTLSVFVSTDKNTGIVYEHDHLNTPTNIYGGYGQTKFVAEKMVLQAASQDYCDAFIYRFGLLCGDTLLGIAAPKDFLGMFFSGAMTMGVLPYDSSHTLTVDISPIDSASRMVVDIATKNKPNIYHIAGENPLSYNKLCTVMKEMGLIKDIISLEQWKGMVKQFSDNSDVQALQMALCRLDTTLFSQMRYMDLFQATGIRFDMTNTHAATIVRCEQDEELIKLYIRKSHDSL